MRWVYLLLLCCLAGYGLAYAAPLAPTAVPEPLRHWVSWVLYDSEEWSCPLVYGQPNAHRCLWPGRLTLDLDERGGRFTLNVQADQAGWARLPGDLRRWPREVSVNGKPALLATRDGAPALWLSVGNHEIAGRFLWERMPETLGLPRDAGLIALTVNGRVQPGPLFNAAGELWLQGAQRQDMPAIANTLNLHVYRKIADGVPLRLHTRLDLDVAGEPREALLTGGLLSDFIPLSLASDLPARLEADGRLRVQLRPGRWQIELISRHPKEVAELKAPGVVAEPWPAEEIWSFAAQPEARLVEVEGAPVVDPRQTEMPEEWKALPAYRLPAGEGLRFNTLRRGDPQPEPDSLTLARDLWLDFAGGGFTFRDHISGGMSRDWRLEAQPDQQVGRIDSDGVTQLITLLEGRAGIEVRRGWLNLEAQGRVERSGTAMPASGWRRDFQRVSATLHLPPGWRLFAAAGVDRAPGSWVGGWTLLDLFLVLIASLAVARLYGWPQAALALAALTLLWHEPDAPRLIWLHLLAAAALLKVLPVGRAAQTVRRYRQLAALALALIALPFMVDQIRLGIYPQLEVPWAGYSRTDYAEVPGASAPATPATPPVAMEAEEDRPAAREEAKTLVAPRKMMAAPEPLGIVGAAKFAETDPNALTQTGPGLPQWRWNQVVLTWNGPVLADQALSLYLLSPGLNLLLNLARVGLLLALAWLLLRQGWGASGAAKSTTPRSGGKPSSATVALVLGLLALSQASDSRADLPTPAMLQELKARLLAPPDCLPECAQIPAMRMRFEAQQLRLELEIHALEPLAVPLPAREQQWMPNIAMLDGKPAEGLFRGVDGALWIKLTPGHHALSLSGALPARGQTQLSLPLIPRRVEVEGEGWRVEGLGENGVPQAQLQLSRTLPVAGESSTEELEARPLPPFLEVVRTLRFGLEWRVQTQVRRASPVGTPVLVEIPLLEGESVTTPGLTVRNQRVSVNLAPGQGDMGWESVLEPRASVHLQAPDTTVWSEIWRADVSPVWHMSSEGITVTRHRDPGGNWLPEWQPWPGETVTLNLLRPLGAPGVTLTLESSRLDLQPGERATDVNLSLTLRSSQGGQHVVTLPPGAELRSATLDGVPYPLRQQDQTVSLPIRPGQQTVFLSWREPRGIVTRFIGSAVDLGRDSVNSTVHFGLGQDRWVLLTGGPRLGPAVLFWGVLLLIVVLAAGLGRVRWTPLQTRHWLLLLIGLSQISAAGALCVVGWLFALAWRGRYAAGLSQRRFNAMQVALALLTLLALSSLFWAVQNGLLGLPDMQIAGNQSDAWSLNWYQDHSGATVPQPWAVTAPLWVYRVLMLLWALWLAYALLDWLRWGWNCYARDGLWRSRSKITPSDDGKATKAKSES